MRPQYRIYSVIALTLLFVLLLSAFSLNAQSDSVDLTGSVTAFTQGTMLVDGHVVDISAVQVSNPLVVGSQVHVTGVSQNGIIIAVHIDLVTQTGQATLTPTPIVPDPEGTEEAEPDGDIIVIVGPVTAINNNVIVIYSFNVLVEPNHPLLTIIHIGDIVRVEGHLGNDGVIQAIVFGNVLDDEDDGGTVVIEGPVQTVNINVVTINNITVQFDPTDPILIGLHPGDVIRVHGDFVLQNNIYILIVVNVIVINDIDIHINVGGGGDGMGMGMGMGDDD
jgi:hypothetical protein